MCGRDAVCVCPLRRRFTTTVVPRVRVRAAQPQVRMALCLHAVLSALNRKSNRSTSLESWLQSSELCPSACECAKSHSSSMQASNLLHAGGAAADRLTRCEKRDLRQYLSAVYPTASLGSMSRQELSTFMSSLDFVYDYGCSTVLCGEPAALLRPATSPCRLA